MNKNSDNQNVTICSVYHSSAAKRLLELNYDFVRNMNPGVFFRWIVGDNTPKGFTDVLDGKKFQIVPGADGIRPVPDWLVGSYRHSEAVNNSLKYITTRFVLFLDIDFYIVRKNWMRDVIAHMQKNNLAFFGVPWHPIHTAKFRYFPSHHALVVDLRKVPVSQLDFYPDYDEMMSPATLTSRVVHKIHKLIRTVSRRMTIGSSHDTGFRIYNRFRSCALFEYATPVFVAATDLRGIPESESFWERILPDRFSYIPKQPGYYTDKGFHSAGFVDARSRRWEEFMWQEKPYGFHIRGTDRLQNDLEGNIREINAILKSFGL